jgi:hypothetical protein
MYQILCLSFLAAALSSSVSISATNPSRYRSPQLSFTPTTPPAADPAPSAPPAQPNKPDPAPPPANPTIDSWPVKTTDVVNEDKWIFLRNASLPKEKTRNDTLWKKEYQTAIQNESTKEQAYVTSTFNLTTPNAILENAQHLVSMEAKLRQEMIEASDLFQKIQASHLAKIKAIGILLKRGQDLAATQATQWTTAGTNISGQMNNLINKGGLTIDSILASNPTSVRRADINAT